MDQPLAFSTARRFEGRTLGGYRVLRAIAAGGMATLYLARKTGVLGFAQNAAIKVVHPHLASDPQFVAMFLDEARIASCINHPNVCRVLDFGAVEGTYFLAMEYVRGESLAELLSALGKQPLPPDRMESLVAWLIAQVCEGLHAAHEAQSSEGEPLGIVHRDVSPQNILIGYDGSVRVVDFGIAYAAERTQHTRDGSVRGRYGYMAPEQMRSLPVDRRADIWSLGVVLREALEGKRLFARDSDAATIFAVTEQPFPTWQPHVHPHLRTIVDRALSRDPEARFPTARALGQELTRAMLGRASGSAEVSQLMHFLYPEQIAMKAAMLRELATRATQEFPSHEQPLEAPAPTPPRPTERSGISSIREVSTLLLRPSPAWRWRMIVGFAFVTVLAFLVWPRSAPEAAAPVATPDRPAAADKPAVEPEQTEPRSAPSSEPPSLTPVVTSLQKEPPKVVVVPKPERPERSAEKPPRKSANAKSTVAIGTTRGWATVWLGSKSLGTTPVRITLPVGTHQLTYLPFGKEPAQRYRIDVRSGEAGKVKLPM